MLKLDLTGKSALVTGASGGIGRKIAKTLADCGACVYVHYFSNKKAADAVVDEIVQKGGEAYAFQADITDKTSVEKMRDEIKKSHAMPDILAINAVAPYDRELIINQPKKDYYSQFESCVMQTVYISQVFVPAMQEKKYGRIIITNTECTILLDETTAAYVAAKRGLDGVAKILAKEVGPDNITVNQVAPGWTIHDKERAEGIWNSDSYDATVPLRHRGTDEDIANAVAFLASDLASFISGAFIPVTGGHAMTSL